MGGSSVTTGYKYYMDLHFIVGLARGGSASTSAVKDGLMEITGADRVAWSGLQTENGSIVINAPNLFGGDKKEGGLFGPAEILFGGPDQPPNPYLTFRQGGTQPGYRNVFSVVYKQGLVACNNPYIKPWSFLRRRITGDWYGGECWYEAKAPIRLIDGNSGSGTDTVQVLVTGSAKVGSSAVFAAGPAGIAPTFVAIDPSSGADIDAAVAAYNPTRGWSAVAADSARTATSILGPWAPHTLSTGASLATHYSSGPDGEMATYKTPAFATYVYDGMSFAPVTPTGTYSDGSPSGYIDSTAMDTWFSVGPYWYSCHDRELYRATAAAGPYNAVRDDLRNAADGLDGGSNVVVGFLGGAKKDGWLYLACLFHFDEGSRRIQIRRSPDNGASLPDAEILYDVAQATDSTTPVQGCIVGDHVVFLCTNMQVLTSANDFAEPLSTGISGSVGYFEPGRRIASYQGLLYVGAGDQVAISADGGLTFGAPITLPIQELRSIVIGVPEESGEPAAPARYCMNPAHVIYQVLTDPDVGMGYPTAVIDEDSFTAAADRLYAEGLGVNIRWTHPTSIEDFIGIVLDHAGGVLVKDRRTGLYKLRLLRKDYEIEDLPVFGPHNCRISGSAQRPTPADSVNELQVTYTDYRDGKEKAVPVRNAAAIAAAGGVVTSKTHSLTGLPTEKLAQRCGLRDLDAMSLPLWRFELTFLRDADTLEPGQPFLLDWPPLGIQVVMRVAGDIDYGSAANGDIKATCVEDVFSLPDAVYSGTLPPPNTGDPAEPEPIVLQRVFEAPYINVVASMSASEFAALPADAGYVVGVAANPGHSRDFTMLVAPDGGDYVDVGNGDFCPTCTSAGLVEPGLQVGIGFGDGDLMADVAIGDLALWDDELVRVDAIDLDAGTLALGRGCGDTLPEQHAAGSRLYFYQHSAAYDRTQHIAGETVNVKLLTNSFSEQLDPADATAEDVTFAERIACPYPPGDYRINGVSIYAIGTATPGTGGTGGSGDPGGGSVPTTPPATGPSGAPASGALGPNGGYPDNAPYPIPQPAPGELGDEQIDGGDFGDAGDIDGWRKQDGSALDSRWAIVDGKLRFHGVAGPESSLHSAYYYAARRSLPVMPLPRYQVTVTAKVQCDPSVKVRVGVALGFSNLGLLPGALNASEAQTYAEETEVTHVFEWAPTAPGVTAAGQYVVVNFTPAICVIDETGATVNASFDDVSVTIEAVPIAATDVALAHLNFDAGLTGWTIMPTPGAYAPSVTVSGGTVTMTPTSEYGTFVHIICDAPVTSFDALGKYVGPGGEVWCNDDTVFSGITQGGVAFGYAYKHVVDGYSTGVTIGQYERGDFTARRVWKRPPLVNADYTLHLVVSMRCALGKSCKVRNLSMPVTDAVVD